jgi:hypothetical protein
MKRKSGLTIVERAIIAVPGFASVVKKLEQQVALRGGKVKVHCKITSGA